MSTTISSLLEQIKQAATILGESDTLVLIEAIHNQISTSKLRLLIVGTTGAGRSSVSNLILGQPELLPTSNIPKAPISIIIDYGEIASAEVIAKNELKTAINTEKIRSFFISPDTDHSEYQSIRITSNSKLLKTSEIRIESLNSKRNIQEWKEIFANTDYLVFVLKAVAILSEPEKKFIREILIPNFGLERVVILINQIDQIPEDEKSSITELVTSFLKGFEAQPVLLEFSTKNQPKNNYEITSNEGYETLIELLKNELVENPAKLKKTAIKKAIELCLLEIEQAVNRQISIMAINGEELEKTFNKINNKNTLVEQSIRRLHNKIEVFINTLIKEEIFREIESFGQAIRQQITNEIMSVDDIAVIKRHLPGYLEALWREFFDFQQPTLKKQLTEEIKRIYETIKLDLKELLEESGVNLHALVDEFDSTPAHLINFLTPKRSNNTVGKIATGMEIGGFLLLVTNLPLGVTAIGMGTITRILGKEGVKTSEKQAIAASAQDAVYEIEQQVKTQVNSHFLELTSQLRSSITDLYNQELDKLSLVLESARNSHQEVTVKKAEIAQLNSVTIPYLKAQLKDIFTE